MPNIKSQEKRDKQNIKRAERNQAIISKIRTSDKKFKASVEKKDVEKASGDFNDYCHVLDKAVKVRSVHKNFAANKKSKAAKLLNGIKIK
ncbi:MAG: 30S ribosomal protein S20 [Actinobacteria bacterium]|nr:30S ribosomal protein S20 [Actinomycetota bacterium]